MYSFVDMVSRHRRTLLLLTVFAACLFVGTEGQSASASASSSAGLLPCSYRGTIILHGDTLILDECTTCGCDNSTVKCDIKSCQPTFCEEPLSYEGECCEVCPYYVPVWQMTPQNLDVVREGVTNDLVIDLNLQINSAGQGVEGEGLWRVGMWASGENDGSGERIGYVEQVLTEGQAATQLVRPPIFGGFDFTIPGIEFTLDATGAECPQMTRMCVEFAKGEAPDPVYPQLPFTVLGVESENDETENPQHLIGCAPFPKCEGVTVSGLSAGYTAGTLTAGKKDQVSITATAQFTDTSIDLSGSGLWGLAMYGSANADGSGEQFQRVEQALSSSQQSQALSGGAPITYSGARAEIDVAGIGCNEYKFVCFDFMRGENPSPSYTFRSLQEADPTKYTVCNPKECEAGITIQRTDANLISGSVVDGRAENAYTIDYSALGQGINIEGTGLWQLTAYGSGNAQGSGEKLNPTTKTFDARQQATKFVGGQTMNYGRVDFNQDMSGQTCETVQFICFELGRGPEATAYFEVNADPEDAIRSCVPAQCEGVIARNFGWEYSVDGAVVPGKETPMTIQASLDTARGSRQLAGEGLWKMGLFGSKNRDGSGERSPYKEQILSEANMATGMEGNGATMEIKDIKTDFDVGSIGCTEFGYICSEFTKNEEMADPNFIFEIQGRRPEEGNTFTSCKKQECLAKAIFTGLEASIRGEGPIIEGMRDNAMEMDLSGIIGAGSTLIEGSGLWTVGMFASGSATGQGRKLGYQEQVLSDANQGKSLEPPANLDFAQVPVNMDMTDISCEDARYLCFKLSKNEAATPNYDFEAEPSERVLTRCIDIQDRCEGVTVTSLDWDREVGTISYGRPADVNLNVNVGTSDTSRDVEGTGLWRLGMYGARNEEGTGEKRAYVSQVLDPFSAGKSLEGGVDLSFNDLEAQFRIDELGCSEFKFLCLEFTKGYGADPNYKFKVDGGGDRIVKCKPEECRGVYVTSTESSADSVMLYEGNPSNYITYDSNAQTTDASGPVVGLNMWNMAMYGSERANGEGPQHGRQEQTLSAYHSSIPLTDPGQVIEWSDVATNFDMTGLTCKQVKHLCTELSKSDASSVDFELNGVPNEQVLKSCFPVPKDGCKGVVITDMDWDMEAGEVRSGRPDDLNFEVTVDSLPGSGSVDGSGLWRLGLFGSTNPQGTGAKKLDYQRQILNMDEAGKALRAGEPMTFPYVEGQFDLTEVGCDEEFQYLCLELAKGQRADPDYMFEVQNGGDTITRCKRQECRKGVKVSGLDVANMAQGQSLLEGSRTNRLLFDMEALTTRDSGGASGDGLWDMNVWASADEECMGPRMNEQTRETLSRYQQNKDVRPGENVNFGPVDMNFDMTGLTCNDVRYICVELEKGNRPNPDFELEAVPNNDVMKKSFRHKCEGVIIDGTKMSLGPGDGEIPEEGGELDLSVTVTSNSNGADVSGRDLWNMETFLSSNPDGQGSRNTIERQTLDSRDASRDLMAGGKMTFNNLAARVSQDDINCEEGTHICVEISRGAAADPPFSMQPREGAGDAPYIDCRKLKCAKPPPTEQKGPKGQKGERGEPLRFDAPGYKGQKGEPGELPRWEDFPPGERGAAGPRGPMGTRGRPGYQGPPGARGAKGPTGRDGNNGLPGQVGAAGRAGPPGDVIMAPQRSKGPAFRPQPVLQLGPAGAPGHPGASGAPGLYGMRGPPGDPGRSGAPGSPGGPGSKGPTGEDGNNGRNGNRGSPGPSGQNGGRGPSGRPGRGGMSGPKGHRGNRGVFGARGDRGAQGDSGSRGRPGAMGPLGLRGSAGLVGETGNRGSRGTPGERGSTGPTGEIGGAGPQGNQGPSGANGFLGAKGDAGPNGDMGETGMLGEPGENGARGANGLAGQMGNPGTPGTAGGLGDNGPVGAPGAQGMPGRRGPMGVTGPGGTRGGSGDAGMQGRPGSTGNQGPQGERGEYGPGGPQGSRGRDGDRGEDGPAGSAGARGTSGERGPGGMAGRPGGMGASGIRGNNGETGPAGAEGPDGDDGEPGRSGTPGRPGDRGAQGPDGTPGNDGKPGPTGTAGNEGRPGPPGPTGLIGSPGNSGPPGGTGPAGSDGNRGRPGSPGSRGPAGEEGKQGNAGPQGATGAQGARGESGAQGAGGPPGGMGQMGQSGSVGARGARGAKGPNGGAGGPGAPGQFGEAGAQGAQGLRGPSGEDGPEGLDGREGGRGEDGVTGPGGDAGPRGIPGLPGQPGIVGAGGATGEAGERGEQGPPGPEGEDGRPGERGPTGAMGPSGQQGPRGPSADDGPPGRNGIPGPTGERGEAGPGGNAGQSGPPGGPGPVGPVGPVGEKGPRGERGEGGPEGGAGPRGRAGAAGRTGSRGPRGESGGQGPVGPQGGPGAGGPRGASGERGETGPVGITGSSGNTGRPGSRGSPGQQGPMGNRGSVGNGGKNGSPGESGRDGEQGAVGPAGLSGPSGPSGLLGGVGRMGMPGPAGLGGRAGSDGGAGQKGPSGQDGSPGPMGAQGVAGSRGSSGQDGNDGNQGSVGAQGQRGMEGEEGPAGAQGRGGAAGMPGPQGPAGAAGFRGNRGRIGNGGPSGPEGPDGPTGPMGPAGGTGARGETGAQGMAGDKGHDGMPGPPGRAGKKGQNGRQGERGGNGIIGPVGPNGENGSPGGSGQRGPRGFNGPGGSRGSRGGSGPEGMPGPPGRPGPPGPTEVGGGYPQYPAQVSSGKGPDPYRYQYGDMPTETEELEDDRLRATFTALHFELIKMLAPQGTEDNPARTCRDIFICHPQKESGLYWIDPNEGSPDDKFQVYCNKKTQESCITASPAMAKNGTWYNGEAGHRLFSDMDDGFEFTYPVNTIQLTFLRLLTNQARQTVTYHCKNSVAAYDAEARNMDMAMRLITTTEAELTADGKSTFRYNIVKDGCQRRTGNWEKTILEYRTKKNTRLPIVDVAPADIGAPNQEFGLEIGPVCFS